MGIKRLVAIQILILISTFGHQAIASTNTNTELIADSILGYNYPQYSTGRSNRQKQKMNAEIGEQGLKRYKGGAGTEQADVSIPTKKVVVKPPALSTSQEIWQNYSYPTPRFVSE